MNTTITIEETGIYENRLGEYMVMEKKSDVITVEYLSGIKKGQVQTLELKGQIKAITNLINERKEAKQRAELSNQLQNMSEEEKVKILKRISETIGEQVARSLVIPTSLSWDFTINFLRENARLWAEVGVIYLDAFENEYVKMTGEKPKVYVPENDPNHLELRMTFPYPDEPTMRALTFPSDIRLRQYGNRIVINNCRFFWKLIDIGFRIAC